jgi:hypothetical protein
MKTLNEVKISENLKYHINNGISLSECIFRYGSDSHIDLIKEVRELYYKGDILLEGRDKVIASLKTGEPALYKGRRVKLHLPQYDSDSNKKFVVYLETGEKDEESGLPIAKTLRFGDPNLKIKNNDKEAADNFQARHQCDSKTDINTAGFWSCNIAIWADHLGLKSKRPW